MQDAHRIDAVAGDEGGDLFEVGCGEAELLAAPLPAADQPVQPIRTT